jgi:hypothetical protein
MSYMVTVLIFKTYYNVLIGMGINFVIYFPIIFFNVQFFPGFLLSVGNFDWMIDLAVFLALHYYYYF